MTITPDDAPLLKEIRRGDPQAWESLIRRYEGRLLSFVEVRLTDRSSAQDVVQETFLGFLTSLPNYDEKTPLESFLFAIAAHKLTDVLRRSGRRPTLPLLLPSDSGAGEEPVARTRKASSMARSSENHIAMERVIGDALRSLIQTWLSRGDFERLKCVELLFVLGWSNKDVAAELEISEQAVANVTVHTLVRSGVGFFPSRKRATDFVKYSKGFRFC